MKGIWEEKLVLAFTIISLVMLVSFLRPDARKDEDSKAYIIAMLISLVYLVLTRPKAKDFRNATSILLVFAIVFSLAIAFFRFFPSVYWSTVSKLITQQNQEYAKYYIRFGYGIPIGGNYPFPAYILALALLIAMTMVKTVRSKKVVALWGALSLLFLLAIFFLGRRGELFVSLLTCLVLYLLPREGVNQKAKILWFLLICMSIVVILIIFYSFFRSIPAFYRYLRMYERFIAGQDISSGRIRIWEIAIELFKKSPLIGNGFGSFATFISEHYSELFRNQIMNAHNLPLQLLAETGIIGTVLILAPLLYILVVTVLNNARIIRNSIQTDNIKLATRLGYFSGTMQVYFLLLSLIDPAFFKLIYWPIYALAVICACKAKKITSNELLLNTNIDTTIE